MDSLKYSSINFKVYVLTFNKTKVGRENCIKRSKCYHPILNSRNGYFIFNNLWIWEKSPQDRCRQSRPSETKLTWHFKKIDKFQRDSTNFLSRFVTMDNTWVPPFWSREKQSYHCNGNGHHHRPSRSFVPWQGYSLNLLGNKRNIVD